MRKWAVVALGLALLCGLPVIASALPVSVPALTASQLRGRILASAGEPYAGYAESNATFGLPSLAGLADLTSLLDGVTKMRVWQAAPDRWRVDVLSDAGERDTYQLGARTYIWASGPELLTEGLGQPALRLPRPADPASTVGQVDIWAEPASGLPLMVEIFGRGSRTPALESQFFGVGRWQPRARVLTPVRGPGTGFNVTRASNLGGALNNLGLEGLPTQLADTLSAGGTALSVAGGTGARIGAPLINAVIVRPAGFYVTFLIAGTVSAGVLARAAAELVADREAEP
jgi:hypothetical protein